MSSSPEFYRAAAKRAWIGAILAGGTLMLLLMAGFAAVGLLILYILSGAE
jgi:hypothetical protein